MTSLLAIVAVCATPLLPIFVLVAVVLSATVVLEGIALHVWADYHRHEN